MRWSRNIAIVLLSTLLMGSKIIIRVPEGEPVQSSSGLYVCYAGEVCTIEFEESGHLGGEPDSQWLVDEFSHWQDREVSDCQGSSDSYCAATTAADYPHFTQLAMLMDSGTTMTMRSVARYPDSAGTGSLPGISVTSRQLTQYYEISGDNSVQVWAALGGHSNPLAENPASGRKPIGQASFSYRYSYQPGYQAGSSHCRVESGEIDLEFKTVLPRLKNIEEKSARFRHQWQEFLSAVIEHEAGHLKIYRRMVEELPAVLSAIDMENCDGLYAEVDRQVKRLANSIKAASADYDKYFEYGAYRENLD